MKTQNALCFSASRMQGANQSSGKRLAVLSCHDNLPGKNKSLSNSKGIFKAIVTAILCVVFLANFNKVYSSGDELLTPDKGKIVGFKYTNEFFQFAFQYPEGWIIATEADVSDINEAYNEYFDDDAALDQNVLAMFSKYKLDLNSGRFNSNLILYFEKIPGDLVLTEYIETAIRQYGGSDAEIKFDSVGMGPYSFTRGIFCDPDPVAYCQEIVSVSLKGHVFSILITAENLEEADTVYNYLKSNIQFEEIPKEISDSYVSSSDESTSTKSGIGSWLKYLGIVIVIGGVLKLFGLND